MFPLGQTFWRLGDCNFQCWAQMTFLQAATATRAVAAPKHRLGMETGFALLVRHDITDRGDDLDPLVHKKRSPLQRICRGTIGVFAEGDRPKLQG